MDGSMKGEGEERAGGESGGRGWEGRREGLGGEKVREAAIEM